MRKSAGWMAAAFFVYVAMCNLAGVPHHLNFIPAYLDFVCSPIDEFLHSYAFIR